MVIVFYVFDKDRASRLSTHQDKKLRHRVIH